jgi:hypothetical protein
MLESKAAEQHFDVPEVARLWNLSQDVVRTIFKSEPGVLAIVRPATAKKRGYSTLRIPESVLQRVHRRMSAPTRIAA